MTTVIEKLIQVKQVLQNSLVYLKYGYVKEIPFKEIQEKTKQLEDKHLKQLPIALILALEELIELSAKDLLLTSTSNEIEEQMHICIELIEDVFDSLDMDNEPLKKKRYKTPSHSSNVNNYCATCQEAPCMCSDPDL